MISDNSVQKAFDDLKQAMLLSTVYDDGTFMCYERNGTARAIPIAVHALMQLREWRTDLEKEGKETANA